MRSFKSILGGGALLASVLAAGSAHAGPTLTFGLMYGIGGALGSISYGTIVLTQTNATTVGVSEVLAPGEVYAVTGAGNALDFNIKNNPVLTLSGLSSGFAPGPAPDTANPFGSFNYSITCTACGNGTSPPNLASMSFSTQDGSALSTTDFVANAGGFYFASDIGVPKTGGGFNTGNVASKGPTTPPKVPEPASLALLGAGLLGLGIVQRRRTAAYDRAILS